MSRESHEPPYALHRPTGQARVRISGRDHYLGPHGSPGSRERYADLIKRWRLRSVPDEKFTIDDLALLYMEHAKEFYTKDGEQTSEVCCGRSALRLLIQVAGRIRARDFGPKLLKAGRAKMIEADRCRSTIDGNIKRIRRVFRWAVAEEHLDVLKRLETVTGLEAGRTKAREGKGVGPVSIEAIDAIKPFVSATV
jgi:hypothetical protein